MSEDTSSVEASTDTTNEAPQDAAVSDKEPQTEAVPTPAQLRKYKLKVDGEELEEEIDLNDETAMTTKLQLAAAAKKRMTEALDQKRKAYDIIKAFEENPESMLQRLGPKGREIAEKFLLEQLKGEMMTPEEKEMLELREFKKKYTEEQEKKKQLEEMTAREKQEYQIAQDFQTTIISALQKTGLPKSPELVKRTAYILKKNLELGLDLTPEQLAAEVKMETLGYLKSIVADADGESLLNLLGTDMAKKIRMHDVAKLKEKQGEVYQRQTAKSQSQPRKESRPMSMDEWKAEVEARLKS